jgi:hypothetical protein
MALKHANPYRPMTARGLGDAGWQAQVRAETLAVTISSSLYHTLDAARSRNNENRVVFGAGCEIAAASADGWRN